MDRQALIKALRDTAQSASNAIASNVSGPVDLLAAGLRMGGLNVNNPMGGSQWMQERGLTREVEMGAPRIVGETLGMAGPALATNFAPKIAGALNQGGANLAAPQVLRKESGMFIGPSAKTWDAEAAKKAQTLAAQGADPRAIWSETGTFKGPDGAWRQEIDDSGAEFKKDFVSQLNAYGARKEGSVFKHKPLYDAYPETSDIVMMRNGVDDANSYGTYDGKNITLEVPRRAANLNQVKSTNIHELQHAIQAKEGFAKGGSPEALARDLPDEQAINDAMVMQALMRKGSSAEDAPSAFLNMLKRDSHPQARELLDRTDLAILDPHSQYLRLAGEAEARATQARIPLDAAQRRAQFPLDSYDVPIQQLIFRGQAPGMMGIK